MSTDVGTGSDDGNGVNDGLTPQRRVENDEYAAMLVRMIRALGLRVAEGDPYDLGEAVAIERELRDALWGGVLGLRRRGYSWQDIGDGAGISRQAAQQRWGS